MKRVKLKNKGSDKHKSSLEKWSDSILADLQKNKKESRYYVGVDPGATGAMCVLNAQAEVLVLDRLPTIKARRSRNILNHSSIMGYLSSLKYYGTVVTIYVEDIWAQPTQGVKAAFTYGYCYAQLLTAIETSGLPLNFVKPAEWQKMFSVPRGKPGSITIVKQMYPDLSDIFRPKNSHNKAEALLIARYGWEKHSNVNGK